MTKIETRVKGIKGKLLKSVPPEEKGSQQYRQWVEEFYKDSVTDADRILITLAEHLREYHIALTINKSTTMKNARKCLQKYFDSLDREKFLQIDEKLTNLFQAAMSMLDKHVKEHGEPPNPLLMKLKDLLLQHYKEERPQKGEKEEQPRANGVENGGENERHDEGSATEISEVGEDVDDSEKSKKTRSSNQENDKTCDDSQEEDKNEGTSLDKTTHNEEESGGNKNGDSAKEDLGNIDAADVDDAAEECESGTATENNHENPSQETDKSAENLQDDKSLNKRNGEQREWKGPKGIVFTRTRESTTALEDWIKEDDELKAVLRPEALVGSGDGNSKFKPSSSTFNKRRNALSDGIPGVLLLMIFHTKNH